jgi:NAD(P)H-hydrate epimerase
MTSHDHVLDRESVRAVDRAAIEEYGIPGVVLMENAARGLASEALDMLGRTGKHVVIVCGSGNNGGDGWALARHLHNAGVSVTVGVLGEPREGSDAALNRRVCRRMAITETAPDDLPAPLAGCDLIVDAIFGTGLDRRVTGVAAAVIDLINASGRRVLAVDVPSGLDCDSGATLGCAVKAARTVTFVARKPCMELEVAKAYLGSVVVVDIGAPIDLVERFGRPVDI